MPLGDIRSMLKAARLGQYALGYFEAWNLESLQGVMDAAEQTRSPIIIGFNGQFLSAAERHAEENLAWYGALGSAAAESASVPCGFIFNECADDQWVLRAVTSGFNLVMLADADASYDDYLQRVKEITKHAHAHGVAVEAEIDALPFGGSGPVHSKATSLTDPERAAHFVDATGVDLLAVSVGNVHIRLDGRHGLDLDQLAQIRARVSIPVVLHGGTGISASALRAAVALGVAKVNFGTYLKQRYLAAIRAALGNAQPNPHVLLGMGSRDDVMVAGRHAVRDAVLERIPLLGCCGRA